MPEGKIGKAMRVKRFLFALALAVCSNAIAAPAAAERLDPRLDQKLTYLSGYKRLHAIADELTQKTGVAIRAGSNNADWRVRDIPLIVCVHDMPLHTLLSRICECAHVELSAETVAGDKAAKPIYRFYRTKAQVDEISDQLNAVAKANLKLSIWAWNTLVEYSKMPDDSADIPSSRPKRWYRVDAVWVRDLANALALLGPDTEAKVMAGDAEQVNVPIYGKPALEALYNYPIDHHGYTDEGCPQQPTDKERRQAVMMMRVRMSEKPSRDGLFSIWILVPVVSVQNGQAVPELMPWSAEPVECARVLARAKKLGFSPPPEPNAAIDSQEQFPDPAFKLLKSEKDWDQAPLQQKVTLDLTPKPGAPITQAQALTALSNATGMNIVCEDFVSQRFPSYWAVKIDPKAKTSAAGVMKAMQHGWQEEKSWFCSNDCKTVIGWERNWPQKHAALVSEALLAGIRSKMNGDGAGLDDLVPLSALNRGQIWEWVRTSPKFARVVFLGREGPALWRLYNSLDAGDKAAAKSDAGLCISGIDPEWISSLFDRARTENQFPEWPSAKTTELNAELNRYLSDPDLFGRLVLKVTRKPLDWGHAVLNNEGKLGYLPGPGTGCSRRYIYSIQLFDPNDAQNKLHLSAAFPVLRVPAYSRKRLIELLKEQAWGSAAAGASAGDR